MLLVTLLGLLSLISGFDGTPINNYKDVKADFCEGQRDGNYPISDVFKYIFCKGGVSNVMSCQDNFIFVPTVNLCVNISTQSQSSFCAARRDGDYNDPWNCHQFFKCYQGYSYPFPCQYSNLIFNPYLDQCVYDYQYPCHQVSSGFVATPIKKDKDVKADFCEGQRDGNYPISDVFKYIFCKGGVSNVMSCQDNFIFWPGVNLCVNISTQSQSRFCVARRDGDYNDPWNCHQFFKCYQEYSYPFLCQYSNLIFNPYLDQCVYDYQYPCHQVSLSVQKDDPCSGKVDGNYPLSDIFTYLSCTGGKGLTNDCPERTIFDPSLKKCIDISTVTTENFCKQRLDGDYMNPWNCERYLQCTNSATRDYPCLINGFVFNPELDVCVLPAKYPCKSIANTVQQKVNQENPCSGKPDGRYLIRDVFAYLQCSGQQGSYVKCPANQIFDPLYSSCRDSMEYNLTTFCIGKGNDQYRNPWNCHSFIACSHGVSHNMSCPPPAFNLVYDPYNNTCEYPTLFPCQTLNGPCSGKADGKYSIPDVFAYLQCSSQQGSYVNCPDNQIFDAKVSDCRDAKDYNLTNFCNGKDNGQYRNPWNCHSFISCSNNIAYNMTCPPPASELVYDPYDNVCEHASIFPCRTLNTSKYPYENIVNMVQRNINIENPCIGKPDGKYLIRDVFAYLQCIAQHYSSYIKCPANQIFDPIYSSCRDSMEYNLTTFCSGRGNDQYRNPWNCHSFIACSHGVSHNMSCPPPASNLVYDPYNNTCEYPTLFPCQTLNSPCSGKADGKYSIPDVFAYLQCSSQQGSYVNCPDNQIFDAKVSDCRDAKDYNLTNFCNGKNNGQYRNPWNCHSFISCSNNIAYNMTCPPPASELVYDPYDNVCEHASIFPCRTLNMMQLNINQANWCSGKTDGNYLIRDVFEYIKCSGGQEELELCVPNQIFDPRYNSCRDAMVYNLTNFCIGKDDDQYRNPWNCHSFISCVNGKSHDMPCATSELVYDPNNNLCEYPSMIRCRIVDNLCTDRGDGKYFIPDVFAYLQCSSHQASYVNCPPNQIFEPLQGSCMDFKVFSFKDFCLARQLHPVYLPYIRHPLNCHHYIYCARLSVIDYPCANPDLVFDPYANQYPLCQDPSLVKCQVLNTNNIMDSSCLGKPDGKYLTPDVFVYLLCSFQQASYVDCPANQIFDPIYSSCRDAGEYNLENFCLGKPDNQYRNPWNCHSFISCANQIGYNMSCPTSVLVYNPIINTCEEASIYPCKTLDNPCAGKADGKYLIPDVFAYLQCSLQRGGYVNCPDNTIFDPKQSNCTDGKEYNLTNFCNDKANGQYRNPWNCHSFISCSNNVSHNMSCATPELVYDPYDNLCEYSSIFPCRALIPKITTDVKIKDICTTLPDGNYATRNVFQILKCKNQKSSNVDCPSGEIYIPGGESCSKDVNIDNFCSNRPQGNWQNPWDCHTFVSCHSAQKTAIQKCSAFVTLVYDPITDTCEYPDQVSCIQINTRSLDARSYDKILVEDVVM